MGALSRAPQELDAQLESCANDLALVEPNDVARLRSTLGRLAAYTRPVPSVEFIPSTLGGVRGVWLVPPNVDPTMRIVFCHGCGFVVGSIDLYAGLTTRLAHATGASVFFVDYRLAPEHTFPAAHEDCWEAYRWARKQGAYGFSEAQCVLMGDSCGASLALSTAITAIDEGIGPKAVVLLSPFVDLTASARTLLTHEGRDPMLTRAAAESCAPTYAPGVNPANPRLSPLHAELAGLPPLLIQAGGRDPLVDDAFRLCSRALEVDVRASLQIWADLSHTWYLFSEPPETLAAIELVGRFIRDT